MKPSILIALILGVLFVQLVPAYSSDPDSADSETEDSEAESADEGENPESDESDEESDTESPALSCVLFQNLGCNTECSITAGAFSIKGTGECVEKNICQCTLEQDESLEGLFRAKFNAENALKKIKQDKKLAAEVLEILRVPFQTIDQTKRQLRKVVYPAISDQLIINDTTPAWERNLVGETDELDLDNIKKYVGEKLKPVLKSSSKKLTSVDYKSNLKNSLKDQEEQDLQSIIDEARRTKNKNLIDIVDDYLKSAKTIKEKKNTEKDDIFDAISHQVIDQFVNHIEQQKKLAAKKSPSRKSPTKGKPVKPSEKNSPKQKKAETSKKPAGKTEKAKKKSEVTSDTRFDLPGFDKNFLDDYGGSINETFENKKYTLQYQKSSGGSLHFLWKKSSDEVDMSISSGGSISQKWRLGDVKIDLDLSSGGSSSETWDFGKSKYTLSKSSGGSWSRKWADGKRDLATLKKYQSLINEWCDKNDFLVSNKKQCTIYTPVS